MGHKTAIMNLNETIQNNFDFLQLHSAAQVKAQNRQIIGSNQGWSFVKLAK